MSILITAIFVVIGAAFLHLGTAVAGVEGRGFTKALLASTIIAGAGWVITAMLGTGMVLVVAGAVLDLVVITHVYQTPLSKAFAAWAVFMVAMIVVVVVPLVLVLGGAMISGAFASAFAQ